MSANYEIRGQVAVITLNNPPVNGLGHDTRLGITAGLDKALADANVQAIVITGAGKRPVGRGAADAHDLPHPDGGPRSHHDR
jgi:3-hydroxyacyl-CoA dehydrogenase